MDKDGLSLFHRFLARHLCPDLWVDRIVDVDLQALRKQGVSTLFFDLDNTLVGWRSKVVSDEVLAWIAAAKSSGFKLHIVSNSLHRRVSHFTALLGIPGTASAVKPRKTVFLDALQTVGSGPGETAIIGDQIFTDILGGKRSGLFTILVSPVDKRELPTTGIARIPERMILGIFKSKGLLSEASSGRSRL